MTTVVNNADGEASGSGMGVMVGILAVVVVLFLFFGWGFPAMRGGGTTGGSTDTGGDTQPQINVPDKGTLDINVNQK